MATDRNRHKWKRCRMIIYCFMFFSIFVLLSAMPSSADDSSSEAIVCTNVDIRNSVENFKKLKNCTAIEGYLQILLIDNGQAKDYDNLSFPEIKEISGYLLLYRAFGLNSIGKLFPNLSVIRGNILFHNYAFVVFEMYQLQEIGLTMLTDILRGSVRIEKNPSLCYVDTVDWDRIAKAGRGGHFIKANKKWEECPNTCPEHHLTCPTVTKDGNKPLQLCWNSNHCQKVCSPECERLNLTCYDQSSKCCHQECLGGCRGPSSLDCVACKRVVYQGRCMKKCPPNTYEYMNHRCVQEKECKNFSKDGKIFWKPFKGQCVQVCPNGYTEVETDRHTCKKCTDRCPKVCQGVNVNNVAAAQGLHGCTYINGSLAIEIKGGYNVIKELEENLNEIQEIHGYLKIARAYPLVSLNFLKELTVIHGNELHKQNYALLVLDNPNLQELWDWKHRKNKLRILGGKVFFHFNSKLCPSKIRDLKNYAETLDWDDRDVSPSSNGDRVACDVTNMNVSVPLIGSRVAKIEWQSFKSYLHDHRSLLGYVIYYREAPYNNVTIFEGRDACGADAWKVRDVEITDDSDIISHVIINLKPFTQYALYIRTYTTTSGTQGAQSSVVYFKTSPDTPTQPLNIKAHSTLHGEIVVSWKAPKTPNGNVTHYIVEGIKEIDSVDFINQRNYCLEPLTLPSYKKLDEDEATTKSMWSVNTTSTPSGQQSGDCCACTKDKSLLEDEEKDAEFQIHFEDFLHNNVYIKNPNAAGKHRRRRALTRLDENHALKSTEMSITIDTSLPSVTTTPMTENGNRYGNNVLVQFQQSVYHHTFLVVSNLRHFTEYTIEAKACQDYSRPDLMAKRCSTKAITTVRTLPLGGADDIRSKTLIVQTANATAKGGFVRWEEPKEPNGMVVAYHIEYKRLNVENYKPTQICITRTTFLQAGGYMLTKLAPGNYSLRVRATSLAGFGNWTEIVSFNIPVVSDGWATETFVLIILAAIFVCLIVGGFAYVMHRRYAKKVNNIIYASVNPEYMSAGLVYEPDEWEVPREKVKLLKELGQGSFGMVYEGVVSDLEEGKPIVRCAAKTVNETASLRERIEFLQEASVMKAFNCHHVIKLVGVVSKGHPTLVIMELMANGDLKSYLRSHRPDSEEFPGQQPPTLEQMLQMAAEISDGMAYLGAKKFVHRDLAARNCMVDENLTVKIGDFGMTRDIYETDYYRKGGKGLLPVRWMSPESLKDGIFDCQSDVWSYGVVLWEMITLAAQPYQGLSNEQVLNHVISGGRMDRPPNCPNKLYKIMDRCWDHIPKSRPTFTAIVEMLLDDVDQRFHDISFYFTQRPAMCPQVDFTEDATPSTPLKSPSQAEENSVWESDTAVNGNNFRFFPSATQLPEDATDDHEDQNGFHDCSAERQLESVQCSGGGDGSKGLSIYSNDSSKGMSVNYSDGSKGSKISNMSNGSIANGHVGLSRRTTEC